LTHLNFLCLWISTTIFGLSACQLAAPEHSPQTSARDPIAPATLTAILDRAGAALEHDQLLAPAGDSAYDYYQAVLKLDPDQPDAKLGLEQIVNRFIHRAQTAIRDERWATARSMLDRARIVDRDHPSLPAIHNQLRQLRHATRYRLDLTPLQLRERHKSAIHELTRFGIYARNRKARVIIHAGSDSEGRWIYEQLNRAPGDQRIRGEIHIGYPPRVVVVVLPKSEF
jgi:hypothetical protein